jgi:hypothetical protein
MIGIYVDDCLVRKEKHIRDVIKDFEANSFNLKIESNLKESLSSCVIEDSNFMSILILKPNLINNLEDKLKSKFTTNELVNNLGIQDLRLFVLTVMLISFIPFVKAAVRMLLYWTKYSFPDLCHADRDLAKCMDKATKETYFEILRVVKFVLEFLPPIPTKIKGENSSLCVFCHSDWTGDSETRISVTRFILYLTNVTVFWRSKAQKE